MTTPTKEEPKKLSKRADTQIIERCICTHPYQDSVYGKQMRVKIIGRKDDTPRCTVCGPPPRNIQRMRSVASMHVKAVHG